MCIRDSKERERERERARKNYTETKIKYRQASPDNLQIQQDQVNFKSYSMPTRSQLLKSIPKKIGNT